jgi:DNA-binding protein WhiA
VIALGEGDAGSWSWASSPACDRRAFLRGVLLAAGSVSMGAHGPHVEFVFRSRARASELLRRLAQSGARGAAAQRRGRWIVYLKGLDEIATLLRVTGANRGLLDFETGRVGREVRNRLNRLLNAEEANLGRTVRAADVQLQAIATLELGGRLRDLPERLRAAAAQRRLRPESDLETLADALGISRSATNHRLRRLVHLAREAVGNSDHAQNAERLRAG